MQIYTFSELDEANRRRWLEFLESSRYQHARQFPEFGIKSDSKNEKYIYVIAIENEEITCIGIFRFNKKFLNSNYYGESCSISGPVFNDIESCRKFLNNVTKHPVFAKVGILKISPYWIDDKCIALIACLKDEGWKSSEPSDTRNTGLIDLTRSEDVIFSSFSKSARREIRRAQRQGVIIREAQNTDEANKFFETLNSMRLRRKLPMINASEYKNLYKNVLSKKKLGIILVAVSEEDVFLGGLLLLKGTYTAHGSQFVISEAALTQLSNLRIAPIMWWTGMLWAKERNCTSLDVEGYEGNLDKTHPMYSIYKYKGEFSPVLTIRISEFYYIKNKLLYFVNVLIILFSRIIRKIA